MFVDSCFCIDLMREEYSQSPGPASAKLKQLSETPLHMSVFALCELQGGARLSRNSRRELRIVEALSRRVTVVQTDARFPEVFSRLQVALRKQGKPIPTMDLLIGSMAVRHGLPLVTSDTRHYRLIPGLVVETY